MTFPNENSFYFLEIIKRRKENPEMTKHASVIRDFYIYSVEELTKLEGKIVELCNQHNARAYFRINVRDARKIALQCLKRLSELVLTEDYKSVSKMYAHVAGEFHHDPNKKWILDLDKPTDDEEGLIDLVSDWAILEHYLTERGSFITSIDTKNGVHLIAKPFRVDEFSKWLETADLKSFKSVKENLHKDNPTILYVP